MAIKEIKREWSPCQLDYVKTFLLHSEKDVKDLPKCCVGSKATVSETDNEYFCTESGWKLGSELGGGGEVVILPETVLEMGDGMFGSKNPLSATPTAGATAKVTYNGAEYECSVLVMPDVPFEAYALGNTEEMGIAGGNADAPFMVMLMPGGEDGAYVICMTMEGVTSVTLSIVQVGAASGGENAGGGVLTVNCKISTSFVDKTTVFSDADKTWAEVKAAHAAGKIVRFVAKDNAIPASDYIGNVQGVIRVNNNEVMSVMFPKSLLYGSETLCSASANDDGSLKIAPSIAD